MSEFEEIKKQLKAEYYLGIIKKNNFIVVITTIITVLLAITGINLKTAFDTTTKELKEQTWDNYNLSKVYIDSIKGIHLQLKEEVSSIDYISLLPIGSIVAFSGDSSMIASGKWKLCDGQEISRDKYSELFDVFGNTWGVGDGETTFNIPDLRGVFLRGVDYGRGIDPDVGERKSNKRNQKNNVGSFQQDAIINHYHTFEPVVSSAHGAANKNGHGYHNGNYSNSVSKTKEVNVKTSSETRPRNVYVNWLIKIK